MQVDRQPAARLVDWQLGRAQLVAHRGAHVVSDGRCMPLAIKQTQDVELCAFPDCREAGKRCFTLLYPEEHYWQPATAEERGQCERLVELSTSRVSQSPSSSITTSTLTPLAAVGLIGLEDMLPLTLGANIGTTITGIMAATVVTSNPVQAWQVALCHLFFNVFGIVLWYPIPKVRQIPLNEIGRAHV